MRRWLGHWLEGAGEDPCLPASSSYLAPCQQGSSFKLEARGEGPWRKMALCLCVQYKPTPPGRSLSEGKVLARVPKVYTHIRYGRWRGRDPVHSTQYGRGLGGAWRRGRGLLKDVACGPPWRVWTLRVGYLPQPKLCSLCETSRGASMRRAVWLFVTALVQAAVEPPRSVKAHPRRSYGP